MLDGRIFSGVTVLAAVVEGGSFVKAADLLGLTDSGVSRAIKRLETRLGVRLLDRTTRSVALTDEGRRLYEEMKSHLDAIEDAAAVASGATSAVRGRLKVDIDAFFLPQVLVGRLGAFCERHPELAIEFVTSLQVGDLVSEGIDLAIRFGQSRRSSLVSRKLIEAPILTVASPRYVKRYGKPKHPLELTRHRCLQFIDPHTGPTIGPSCAPTRQSKYRSAVRSPSRIRSQCWRSALPAPASPRSSAGASANCWNAKN